MRAPRQCDLVVGAWGESFIATQHGLNKALEDERRYDLTHPDGRTIEVKTDTHPLAATPNMFMERWTEHRAEGWRIDGGPWRAAKHGVATFVYLHQNGGTKDAPLPPVAWWFDDVPALVARIDDMHARKRFQQRGVLSGAVRAIGLLVPRAAVEDLARRVGYA